MEDIEITYVFPEEKLRLFEEREKLYDALNYPIVIDGKYLCDLDWVLFEMYTASFHKFPEEQISKFLKENGYIERIIKGEVEEGEVEYEIDKYLSHIHANSGVKTDIDYAERLHMRIISLEYQEWKKKIKEGPRWEPR